MKLSKISMLMLVAGAAIAVVAPVASAHQLYTEHSYFPHKVVKHAKPAAGKSGTVTKVTQTTPRPPLYIYVPPFTGTPAVSAGTDWCVSNMVDCTDQQLCETWGLNCSTGGVQSAPAQSAPEIAPATSDALGLGSQLAAATVEDSQSASQTSSAVSSSQDSSDDC